MIISITCYSAIGVETRYKRFTAVPAMLRPLLLSCFLLFVTGCNQEPPFSGSVSSKVQSRNNRQNAGDSSESKKAAGIHDGTKGRNHKSKVIPVSHYIEKQLQDFIETEVSINAYFEFDRLETHRYDDKLQSGLLTILQDEARSEHERIAAMLLAAHNVRVGDTQRSEPFQGLLDYVQADKQASSHLHAAVIYSRWYINGISKKISAADIKLLRNSFDHSTLFALKTRCLQVLIHTSNISHHELAQLLINSSNKMVRMQVGFSLLFDEDNESVRKVLPELLEAARGHKRDNIELLSFSTALAEENDPRVKKLYHTLLEERTNLT